MTKNNKQQQIITNLSNNSNFESNNINGLINRNGQHNIIKHFAVHDD